MRDEKAYFVFPKGKPIILRPQVGGKYTFTSLALNKVLLGLLDSCATS